MDLFFVYTSRLCQVVASAAGELSRGITDSPLLPAINVLLQWIATHPAFLKSVSLSSMKKPFCIPQGLPYQSSFG